MAKNTALLLAVAGFLLFNLSLALAVFSNPSLRLFSDYLSSYGEPGSPSAPFFNYGAMLVGVIVILVFLSLKKSAGTSLGASACLIGALCGVALVGVGVYPTTTSLHYPFSAAFFALAGLLVLAYSADYALRIGYKKRLVALGVLHVLLSLLFAAAEATGWIAPFFETMTVFAFQIWVLAAAIEAGRN